MQGYGAVILPLPEQGPSEAINVGHESTVPINSEQGRSGTHP